MPEADVDHIYDYDPKYLADILASVKTIAMVGASADKTKFSYGVLRQLSEIGYDILPVNPNPNLTEIRGLKSIARSKRSTNPSTWSTSSAPVKSCTALPIKPSPSAPRCLWGQIGVYDDAAAKLAEGCGPSGGHEPLPQNRTCSDPSGNQDSI